MSLKHKDQVPQLPIIPFGIVAYSFLETAVYRCARVRIRWARELTNSPGTSRKISDYVTNLANVLWNGGMEPLNILRRRKKM